MTKTPRTRAKRSPLDREAWVLAALTPLAREGIDGVRIEVLANKLGVTKGSFYWHFKDRPALYAAMLEHWRRRVVVEIMERLKAVDDPKERYRCMMRLPTDKSPPDFDLELAVRLWARRDASARAAIVEADKLRINFVIDVIVAAGAPAETARSRAVLIFAYLRMGTALMDDATREQCEQLLIARFPPIR